MNLKSDSVFPKKLAVITVLIIIFFLTFVIFFLNKNTNFLTQVDSVHFPLVERNAINIRLSNERSMLRQRLIHTGHSNEAVLEIKNIRDTIKDNLEKSFDLLPLNKEERIELMNGFQREDKLEDDFFDLIKNKNVATAKQLLNSSEFTDLSEANLMIVADFVEKASAFRDQGLSELTRYSGLMSLFSGVVLILLSYLFLKIYKTYLSNLGQRKLVEKELDQQKIKNMQQSKLASLGKIAAGVAHEVNNPLTIFNLHLRNIEKSLKTRADIDPKVFEGLEKSKHNVQRIANIINGLKILSRENVQEDFKSESLYRIIRDALEVLSEKIKGAGVNIDVTPTAKDIVIHANAVQISQVIANLISNSIDAIIDLDSKWIKIDTETKDNKHQITFTDSGLGIPDSVAKHLMTPFYTTKGVNKGTGLGLSLSREIARNHQGDLYYNKNSSNTQFVLELPVL